MSLSITATDHSVAGAGGAITAWDVDWGDSTSHASGAGPWSHTYGADGTYSITLQVTSPDGTNSVTHSITVAATPAPPSGAPPITVGSLLFGDEFDGTAGSKPDNARWRAKTSTPSTSLANFSGWTQIELDGSSNAVITAAKQSSGRWNTGWLSGMTGYNGKRYIEARVKVAGGTGPWNGAIWEWGYPFGSTPSIEVDVCEQLGKDPTHYHATLHNWNGTTNPQSGKTLAAGVNLSSDYHVYGAAIYADRVDWYLDNVKMATTTAAAVGLSDLTTWEEVANVSLNMGGWGGAPTVSSPVHLICDYVHVYRIP